MLHGLLGTCLHGLKMYSHLKFVLAKKIRIFDRLLVFNYDLIEEQKNNFIYLLYPKPTQFITTKNSVWFLLNV